MFCIKLYRSCQCGVVSRGEGREHAATCSLLFKTSATGAQICIPPGHSLWREEHSSWEKLEGSWEKRKTINTYQDIYARAGAGSFESPHKADCTLTAPESMPSRRFQEESWHFCSYPARKTFSLRKVTIRKSTASRME